MQRPKVVQDEWRKLDDDLSEAGIDVYFALGGTCSWEAGFSDGKPPGPARRLFLPALAAAAPVEEVTPSLEGSSASEPKPGKVPHSHEDNPPTVLASLGDQLPMVFPDGAPMAEALAR